MVQPRFHGMAQFHPYRGGCKTWTSVNLNWQTKPSNGGVFGGVGVNIISWIRAECSHPRLPQQEPTGCNAGEGFGNAPKPPRQTITTANDHYDYSYCQLQGPVKCICISLHHWSWFREMWVPDDPDEGWESALNPPLHFSCSRGGISHKQRSMPS